MDRRSAARQICLYRSLECEIYRVLHLEEGLQQFGIATLEDWTNNLTERLESWYRDAQHYTRYNMLEFKHVQYNLLKVRLHRPTPRIRTRALESRSIVLDASKFLIQDYLGQKQRSRLLYPWHGVHVLFEAAVVSLEACWSSSNWDTLRPRAKNMLDIWLPRCIQLITDISQRWKVALLCAERLTPLLAKCRLAYTEGESATLSVFDAASVNGEIHDLLFPDGPLTWDSGGLENFDPDHGLDFTIFDELVEFNDIDSFQLMPDWQLSEPDFFSESNLNSYANVTFDAV